MKKAALLFIAALIITASIDFIWPFTTERADGDEFEHDLNTAEMLTYQDPDFGFTVRYPSFFALQPDSMPFATITSRSKAVWTHWRRCFMQQAINSATTTSSSAAHNTKTAVAWKTTAIIRDLSVEANYGLCIRWFIQTVITTTSAGS